MLRTPGCLRLRGRIKWARNHRVVVKGACCSETWVGFQWTTLRYVTIKSIYLSRTRTRTRTERERERERESAAATKRNCPAPACLAMQESWAVDTREWGQVGEIVQNIRASSDSCVISAVRGGEELESQVRGKSQQTLPSVLQLCGNRSHDHVVHTVHAYHTTLVCSFKHTFLL
jgi:hypothetical protein